MAFDLPGPRGLPFLGSLVSLGRDPLAFFGRLREEYGDLVHFRASGHDVVYVGDPALIPAVLKQKPSVMHKDAMYALMRPLLGNGLVTSEGESWKRHRALAAPSLSKRHVEGYAASMARSSERYAEGLADGEQRDLHHDLMELTQEIALHTLFGEDMDLDVTGVGPAVGVAQETFHYEAHGLGRVLPDRLPTPTRRRGARAIGSLDEVIYAAIAERRRLGLGDDLLSRLILATDDDGRGFDDKQLRDEAVTLFLAGHETTAVALTFTLWLLGSHPGVRAWVLEELDADDGPLDASTSRRFPRVQAAVKEAMRLYPPAWIIGRETQEPVDIGGHTIPAKTQLVLSPWTLHRDERWFVEPLAYRPQRWTDGSLAGLPKMAYIPFGGGPRICIGNHFAMLEAGIAAAAILRRVVLEPLDPVPPEVAPLITIRPTGPVSVRVHLRD